MADNRPPDWTVFGAAIAGIITAIGGAMAVLRRNPSVSPTGTDRTVQTLDGVFKLVEQLQEEIVRLLSEVKELRAKIADLERQIKAMGWPPPGNPPAGLT